MTSEHEAKVVCLAHADTPAQAHIWQNALEQEGIFGKVVGDYLDAGLGDIPGMKAELWVYEKDVERATKILEEHKAKHGKHGKHENK